MSAEIRSKKEYRKAAKAKHAALSDAYRSDASAAIALNVLALKEMKEAGTVLAYFSVGNEPATLALISRLLESGKKVCLPLCTDIGEDGTRTGSVDAMEARLIRSFDDLGPGAYGIPEPKAGTRVVRPEKIDFIILPCVSAGRDCSRLGHGAGYYDKFLSRIDRDCFTAALCYEELMEDELPMEEHDMRPDAIITEKQIYRWRR